MSKPLTTNYGV